MPTDTATATVKSTTNIDGYASELSFAPPHDAHHLVADQAADVEGGTGRGPNPFSYLYAALASCTAMTIRGYASRKQLPLTDIHVEVFPVRDEGKPLQAIDVRVTLDGDLSDDDRAKLLAAGKACPVRKVIESGVPVNES